MPDVTSPSDRERGGRAQLCARELWVRGVVQGVGFRPFVYNLALRHGVSGWVRNTSAGVHVLAQGDRATVEAFVEALPREAPPRSFIASYDVTDAEPIDEDDGFRILESAADPDAYQLVSPDIALCADCRRELLDPTDRRYGYPFINCTNCGPRFTIIESLPYDRERTTMRHFPLCPDCRREYEDPTDRRFHAEPNACPVCGPRAVLLAPGGDGAAAATASVGPAAADDVGERGEPARIPADTLRVLARGDREHPQAAVEAAAELLRGGCILAVKGLGGFHLACDATDPGTVRELKRRKGRPDKPLAVMFRDLEQAREHCRVSDEEAALLESPEHPIVLLEWRRLGPQAEPLEEVGGAAAGATAVPATTGPSDGAPEDPPEIAPDVALRQRCLGAMLPYTPLHLLLLRAAGRPLVMTSGNLAEEPIVRSWDEAERLSSIPDAYLLHDRSIRARYDDSVATVRGGRARSVRRSRGYAPFPLPLPEELPQVLACGAEVKNTFCLTRDRHAFLSQHIGDLENLETLEHFEETVELYRELFRADPGIVAFDLHPEYLATKYAQELLRASGADGGRLVGVGVQHHHAHIAACMVENAVLEPVIGMSLDGLGFGTDGALWGGEVLVSDLLGFRRVAHLEYLPLAGGALAIRTPARTAAGWLAAALGPEAVARARRARLALDDDEAEVVLEQVSSGINAPLTSSCGRLFDCVSALAGLRQRITYEGQAAIELEMVSAAGGRPYPYRIDGDPAAALAAPPFTVTDRPGVVPQTGAASASDPAQVRLAPLLAGVLDDVEAGCTAADIGSRLHASLAVLVVDLSQRIRVETGLETVALSGGVFQNRLLSDLCEDGLQKAGFRVLTHALVPANDGGLALGQAVVAGYNLRSAAAED